MAEIGEKLRAPSGCGTGSYKPKQIGGIPLEPCREGFEPKSTGLVVWCCRATDITSAPELAEGAATAETGETAAGQQFAWSPSQQGSIQALIERASSLLRQPVGMTPQERERLYGYVTKGIQAPLAGELRNVQEGYARAGLVGSPAQIREEERVRRDIRQKVAEARRGLAVSEQATRAENERAGLTTAGGILTQTAAMERAIEEANAARRAEGMNSIQQLQQLFSTLFGATSGNYNTILQGIINRMQGGQQSAGFADWLPYLAFMGGQSLEG